MKPKYKIILTIALINLTIFNLCTNIDIKAQDTYSIGVKEDKEYIWEVTELDSRLFGRVLGYEPNFDVGDKTRILIKEVVDLDVSWRITFYFWDYQVDWTQEGTTENIQVFKLPINYEEQVFLPVPIEDYLAAVAENFPADYQVDGLEISRILRSEIDEEYIHERTYNSDGVLIKEAVYEYLTQRRIVQVEATFQIVPMGPYFIGFILIAIGAIIFIIMKNRKYSVKLL